MEHTQIECALPKISGVVFTYHKDCKAISSHLLFKVGCVYRKIVDLAYTPENSYCNLINVCYN